jgi:hypothetical protein
MRVLASLRKWIWKLLVARRWWFAVVTLLYIIGGLVWGFMSHQVAFTPGPMAGTYDIYASHTTGNVYVHVDGSSAYYIARAGDFNPPIDLNTIPNHEHADMVVSPQTTNVNANLAGVHISKEYLIEKLAFYDHSGNLLLSYTTADYQANPKGFYDNQWEQGAPFTAVGVLVLLLFLFILRWLKQQRVSGNATIGFDSQPREPLYQTVGENFKGDAT